MSKAQEETRICPHCGQALAENVHGMRRREARRVPLALLAIAVLLAGVVAWGVYAWDGELPSRARGSEPAGAGEQVGPEAEQAQDQVSAGPPAASDGLSLAEQVQPPGGYPLPASYGNLGPELVQAGAIDYDRFAQLYLQRGQPLTSLQVGILKEGSDSQVVIDPENAHFLLNLFWAVGLTNQNPILVEGPMMQRGREGVGSFASTGGWTLGSRQATELYSSVPLIQLTEGQQARVEEVANAIYRPCCGNHTAFPDCNHGMAMLGLLQLMATDGASVDEMFQAAKYVNGFWYPQQTLEVALYYQATEGASFADLDARQAFGAESFSAAGFGRLHQWLAQNNLLKQAPSQGGSCGV
ncbi:MAG: hypothetical protein M8467_08485 [Anaerolineae bacterium]|nr:hypothetical protein [Anaerolineae bacterium]